MSLALVGYMSNHQLYSHVTSLKWNLRPSLFHADGFASSVLKTHKFDSQRFKYQAVYIITVAGIRKKQTPQYNDQILIFLLGFVHPTSPTQLAPSFPTLIF